LKKLAHKENIPTERIENLIGEYLYTQKFPRGQDIVDLFPDGPPPILKRKGIISRLKKAIEDFIDIFEW